MRLFPDNFLHLANLLFHFAAYLFVLAFGFQVWIIPTFSYLFFDLTFRFMNFAPDLIFGGLASS
jgi:hypothetical protein